MFDQDCYTMEAMMICLSMQGEKDAKDAKELEAKANARRV